MLFKLDGELAVKVVRDRSARQQGGKLIVDSSASEESQSNGTIEEAGKTVRDLPRY